MKVILYPAFVAEGFEFMTKCCKFEVPVVDEFPRREMAGGMRLVPLLHPFQSGSVFPQTLKTAARNNPSYCI